jgi:hypothetical protein
MADPTAWVALGIAVYGASLGTYKAWTGRSERKEALRREVRVTGTFRPHPDDPINRTRYILSATNFAQRPVEIVKAGLVVSDGPGLIWAPAETTPSLPARLGDGEGVTVEMPDDWVEPFVLDPFGHIDYLAVMEATGQVYLSESNPRPDADTDAEGGEDE